jgi:predicted glycosyltransferase
MHTPGAARDPQRDSSRSFQPLGDANERPGRATSPKFLLYSHDTFGLGNIRRSLLLGELLTAQYPHAAVLLVTGSPVIHAFRLPDGMDYIKLPCVDRVQADQYVPRFLTRCPDEVRQTRRAIIERAVLGFDPDLIIVDKRPGGIDGELLPTLEALESAGRRARMVLGVRDILDTPEVTRRALEASGSFDLIDRYYDEVWIYGSRLVFDAVAEYRYPPSVARKTRYCGYLRRSIPSRRPSSGPARMLVTTGGGGDGEALVRAYLEGLALQPPGRFASTVVFGPHLSLEAAARFRLQYGDRNDLRLLDFEPDLSDRYAEADLVVSMAGYNTVCEVLASGVRAVLVPRAEPVQEQLIRARRLAARGCVRMVEPDALTPASLFAAIAQALAHDVNGHPAVDLEGATRIRRRVRALVEAR